MNDLISKGELFNRLASVWTIEDAYAVIQDMPTEESKIIKCRDCRWNDGTAYCEHHYRDVKGDDFCSWAERRNNDL